MSAQWHDQPAHGDDDFALPDDTFKPPPTWACQLGIVLAFLGGFIDAVAVHASSEFETHMSGCFSEIGIFIHGHASQELKHLRASLINVVSFWAGCFLYGIMIPCHEKRFGANLHGVALLMESGLLVLAGMVYPMELAWIAVVAGAGFHNAMSSYHLGKMFRSTHVSGTCADIGIASGKQFSCFVRQVLSGNAARLADADADKLALLVSLLLSFIVGVSIGTAAAVRMEVRLCFVMAGLIVGTVAIPYTLFRSWLVASPTPAPPPPVPSLSYTRCVSPADPQLQIPFFVPWSSQVLMAWLMSLFAGMIDAVGFLRSELHCSSASSSATQFGAAAVLGFAEQKHELRTHGAVLMAFMFGASVCGFLVAFPRSRPDAVDGNSYFGLVMMVEALALLLAAFSPVTLALPITSVAAGLHNATSTLMMGTLLRTTHVTGTTTDLGTSQGRILAILFQKGFKPWKLTTEEAHCLNVDTIKAAVLLPIIICFMVGASCGTWFLSRMGYKIAYLTLAFGTAMTSIVYVFLRRRIVGALTKLSNWVSNDGCFGQFQEQKELRYGTC